jgi:hypothetical protein
MRLRQNRPKKPSDPRRSLRVLMLAFAPLGPALTLAPRFPRVMRIPGAILIDFRNPHAMVGSSSNLNGLSIWD